MLRKNFAETHRNRRRSHSSVVVCKAYLKLPSCHKWQRHVWVSFRYHPCYWPRLHQASWVPFLFSSSRQLSQRHVALARGYWNCRSIGGRRHPSDLWKLWINNSRETQLTHQPSSFSSSHFWSLSFRRIPFEVFSFSEKHKENKYLNMVWKISIGTMRMFQNWTRDEADRNDWEL